MNKENFSILISISNLKNKGGVANFYNSVLPFLKKSNFNFNILQIGSSKRKKLFYRLRDQLCFKKSIKSSPNLVFINPSLDMKSFFRDGLFIWQAKKKNLPVLVFFHGWDNNFAKKVNKKFYWFFKKTFAKADAFIVLASDFKNQLRKWGIKVPINILSTAIDNDLLKDFNIKEKIKRIKKSDILKILFLARIEKEKGIFETIDACRLLLAKNFKIKLSIAGDGSCLDKAKSYVNSLHIDRYVNFLGYVTGKKKIETFISHDIYCFPSYGEGMPVSLLEAMAFGLPVITRPVGGIKDFFQDGKMGYLTETKDPRVIAQLIENFIYNKEDLMKIATFNHEYSKKHFLASLVAQKIIKIIKKTFLQEF